MEVYRRGTRRAWQLILWGHGAKGATLDEERMWYFRYGSPRSVNQSNIGEMDKLVIHALEVPR